MKVKSRVISSDNELVFQEALDEALNDEYIVQGSISYNNYMFVVLVVKFTRNE